MKIAAIFLLSILFPLLGRAQALAYQCQVIVVPLVAGVPVPPEGASLATANNQMKGYAAQGFEVLSTIATVMRITPAGGAATDTPVLIITMQKKPR